MTQQTNIADSEKFYITVHDNNAWCIQSKQWGNYISYVPPGNT